MASQEDDGVDFGDNVDVATFEQLLEMDEGEDEDGHEFSSSIVFDFLTQAQSTFSQMDKYLKEKNLKQLSDLGHFLKGSSSTVGFTHIKDACEKIQNLGKGLDEKGDKDEKDEAKLLKRISECLEDARNAYVTVDALMEKYFALLGVDRP